MITDNTVWCHSCCRYQPACTVSKPAGHKRPICSGCQAAIDNRQHRKTHPPKRYNKSQIDWLVDFAHRYD